MNTHNICFHGGKRKILIWYRPHTPPLIQRYGSDPTHPLLEIWLAYLKLSFSGVFFSKICFGFSLEWHIEAILMSTHSICFATKMTKNITKLIFLSMDVNYSSVEMTDNYCSNSQQNIIELRLGTRGKNFSRRPFSCTLTMPIFWKK